MKIMRLSLVRERASRLENTGTFLTVLAQICLFVLEMFINCLLFLMVMTSAIVIK